MEEAPRVEPAGGAIDGRWIRLAAGALALLAALVISTQIQLSMVDHGHDWWRLFLWQASGWGYWALVAPRLLRAGARLLRPERRPRLWPAREGAAVLGLTLLHVPVVALAFTLLQPYVPVATYSFRQSLTRAIDSWLLIDLLIGGAALAVGYGLAGYREARRAELRESRLETELARAQLETLRLQIQPHFLFNTLNSIAALVRRRDNDRALAMLVELGELLRATLERSEHARGPLRDELDFVRRYVELQKTRFGDRLTVAYRVDEGGLDLLVPTLLLQPLVENAIRHGVAPRAAPGRVEIRARVEGDALRLEVVDDGVGLPEGFAPETTRGVGLANTRSRLRQLYGERAVLAVQGREGGGCAVVVTLPAEPAAELPRAAVG